VIFILGFSCFCLNGRVAVLRDEIAIAKQSAKIHEEKVKKLGKINNINQLALDIKDNNVKVYKKMLAIFSNVPNEIRLKKIFFSKSGLGFEGEANDQDKLLFWAKYLEKNKIFKQVEFERWKVGSEIISFSFKESGE